MLRDDMTIDQIDLKEYLQSRRFPTLQHITQEEYDLIQIKDQLCIYVIKDSPDNRIYHGNKRIITDNVERIYLIGPANDFGEYIIYLNEKKGYVDQLIPISSFDSPQKAINAINHFNRVGFHDSWALQSYNIIISFIDEEISINDLIIGIISLFGYKDSPNLQEIIAISISYGVQTWPNKNTLPVLFVEDLQKLASHRKEWNYIYKYYSDLYDLVVKNNFFKKYKKPDATINQVYLKEVIREIYKIITQPR